MIYWGVFVACIVLVVWVMAAERRDIARRLRAQRRFEQAKRELYDDDAA